MKHQLQTHSDIDLFEINFNNRKVVDSALDAPIKCGFEAETIWPVMHIRPGAGWDEVKPLLSDSDAEKIESRYIDWLSDTPYMRAEIASQLQNVIDERIKDDRYTEEFFDQLDEKALQQFREFRAEKYERFKAKNLLGLDEPKWWKGSFIRVRMDKEFGQWMREKIDGTDEMEKIRERAFSYLSTEDYTIDFWVSQHYATWAGALEYLEIEIDGTNVISRDPINTIAQEVKKWVKDNSKYRDVVYGGYHSGRGLDNDFWRVENDSSIIPDSKKQSGAEIVSPVYNSPRQMLAEMKKLFQFFKDSGVETNSTTGLHVTMSWFSDETTTGTNKLKMAVLLGDQYLLQQFQRLQNDYTKSQMARLQKAAELVKNDNNTSEDWESLETFFKNNISLEKMSSINFKELKNEMGNRLMEFRIAGNRDYEKDFKKVIKAVTRYAAVMQAGHDDSLYNKDYIKAVAKLLTTSPSELIIPQSDQEFAQQIVDWDSVDPKVLSAFQDISDRKYYTDISERLSTAYKLMKIAKRRRAESENNVTEDLDYTWEDFFTTARLHFVESVLLTLLVVAEKKNRKPIQAKEAVAFRQALKYFEYTPEELWEVLQQTDQYKAISGDPFIKSKKFAQAFNTMLKMDAAQYLKPVVEITFNPRNEMMFLNTKLYDFLANDKIFSSPDKLDDYLKQVQFDDPVKLRSSIGIITKEQYSEIKNIFLDLEDVVFRIKNIKNTVLPLHRQGLKNSTTDRERQINQSLIDTTGITLQNDINYVEQEINELKKFVLEHGFIPAQFDTFIKIIKDLDILPSSKEFTANIFWIYVNVSSMIVDGIRDRFIKMGISIRKDINASREFSGPTLAEQKSPSVDKVKPQMKIKSLTADKKNRIVEIPVRSKAVNLFEINFNSKDVLENALNANIQCGFEAETVWPNISDSEDGDDWLSQLSWVEISRLIKSQYSESAVDKIIEAFEEYVMTYHYPELYSAALQDLIDDNKEKESYINDFVSSEINEEEVEEYKNDVLTNLKTAEATEELEERSDWEFDEWAREFVEEEREGDYIEWLENVFDDDAVEVAMDLMYTDYTVDDWLRQEYRNDWELLLRNFDLPLHNENSGGGREEVAEIIEDWASDNSISADVRMGEYHSGKSLDNDYWRVEDDSSIEGDGTHAEIVSPVYDTPGEMLAEFESLMYFMIGYRVETNESTGLHFTMSVPTEGAELNRLKMAVLLGDPYLLKQFDRLDNTYTKSQEKSIRFYLKNLNSNYRDNKSLEELEKILSRGVSDEKMRSINFKSDENIYGNTLIEFRIAGNKDYTQRFDEIKKTVVRYATIMLAGYDAELYRKDYIKALFKIVNTADDVDKETVRRSLSDLSLYVDNDVVAAFNSLASGQHFRDIFSALSQAYFNLRYDQKMMNEQESTDGDSKNKTFTFPQKAIARAFAMLVEDMINGKLRSQLTARHIFTLRKVLRDFDLSVDDLIIAMEDTNTFKNNGLSYHETHSDYVNAVRKLFKTDTKPPKEPEEIIRVGSDEHIIVNIDDITKDSKPDVSKSLRVVNKNEYQRFETGFREVKQLRTVIKNKKETLKDFTNEALSAAEKELSVLQGGESDKIAEINDRIRKIKSTAEEINNGIQKNVEESNDIKTGIMEPFLRKYNIPYDISSHEWSWIEIRKFDRQMIERKFNVEIIYEVTESVFDKFDKLPLLEQLRLIDKIDKKKIVEALVNIKR